MRRVLLAVLAAAGVLAGCGGPSKLAGPPPAVLTKALDGLGGLHGIQATLSLQVPSSSLGGPRLSVAQSQAIEATRIVVTIQTPDGHPLDAEGSSQHPAMDVDVAMITHGDNLLEVRSVDHRIYARVDLPGLGTQLALPAPAGSALARAQSVLRQDSTKVAGLANLAAGQWVDVPASGLRSVGTGELTRLGTPLDPSTLQPATLGRIVGSLLAVVSSSTVADTGPVKGGESYSATFPLRALLTSPLTTAAALAGTFGTSANVVAVIGRAEAIPAAATAQVNFVVSGNRVTQAVLPLGQLAPNSLTARDSQVVVDFSPGGAFTAPQGATALDLVQLLIGLHQGVGGI